MMGKSTVIYVTTTMIIVVIMWITGANFANIIKNVEIITPKHNIECVVVSRMFNTSVDCWEIGSEQ